MHLGHQIKHLKNHQRSKTLLEGPKISNNFITIPVHPGQDRFPYKVWWRDSQIDQLADKVPGPYHSSLSLYLHVLLISAMIKTKNRKYNVQVKVVNIFAVTAKKVKSSQEKKKETYFGYYLNLRPEHMTMVAPWSIKVNQPWFWTS